MEPQHTLGYILIAVTIGDFLLAALVYYFWFTEESAPAPLPQNGIEWDSAHATAGGAGGMNALEAVNAETAASSSGSHFTYPEEPPVADELRTLPEPVPSEPEPVALPMPSNLVKVLFKRHSRWIPSGRSVRADSGAHAEILATHGLAILRPDGTIDEGDQ